MRLTPRAFYRHLLPILLCSLAASLPSSGDGRADTEHAAIVREWLVLGPVAHPLPVFHDETETPEFESLLGEEPFAGDFPRPAPGHRLTWFGGRSLEWRAAHAGKKGELTLEPPEGTDPAVPLIALLATRITLDRWAEVEISLLGSDIRCAWLDGDRVVDCDDGEQEDGKKGKSEVDETLELPPGSYTLLVQAIRTPQRKGAWTAGAAITPEDDGSKVVITAHPTRRELGIREIIDVPHVDSMALAPDGRHLALSYRRFVPGTDDSENRVEIRALPDGELVDSRRVESAGSVGWSDDGRYVSWLAADDDAASLFLLDRETGRTAPLLDDVEGLKGYLWSPNGKVIAYWTEEEAEEDDSGVKRLEGLMDRWATFRDKEYLHLVTVPDGIKRRLTTGGLTTLPEAFSPTGDRLLFYRDVEDLTRRPYYRRELWETDVETLRSDRLCEMGWLGGASYAPDGRRLLILADPAAFEGAGSDLPEGTTPNSNDTQLFIWDPDSDEVEAITREFDPTVMDARWNRQDGRIYLLAQDRDRRTLFRYDPEARRFEALKGEADFVTSWAVARRAPVAAAVGSSAGEPEMLAALDLDSGEVARARHPADGFLEGVLRGAVEPWSFVASGGRRIDGRVYLPPGFDSKRKYPAIVYYYGGTLPTDRSFGGRYPKEWWAARGYVVYVLQPSGAVGYGQRFSALHVNDWGKTTLGEVIQGTREFLEAHPYVDPDRVGCIGASYGGFLTMLVATESDLFAAAVSHAGISSIATYWGQGYWGYSYNAVSAAGSFPWNRPDIYVGQSPLFRADRTKVPILLTHGDEDTNVPPGESDALYVALKLLGKEVEYVQVKGQDHWILDHDERIEWSETILAWFDRWLKGQPEWWDDLYPPE